MKRNTLLAGLSLSVAGIAIGVGAIVSSTAMAGSSSAPPAAVTLTVVDMGPGGAEPVECTFDDVDPSSLPGLPPIPVGASADVSMTASTATAAGGPSGVPADGSVIDSGSFTVSADGEVTVLDDDGVVGDDGTLTITGPDGEQTEISPILGAPAQAGGVAVGADGAPQVVFSGSVARQGTPDECAAIRTDMQIP